MEDYKTIQLTYLLEVTEGDLSFMQLLVQQFIVETPSLLDSLFVASKSNDAEECGRLLHKLKSSYVVLGVDEILAGYNLLHKKPIDENDVELINQNQAKILETFDDIQKEITTFIESY